MFALNNDTLKEIVVAFVDTSNIGLISNFRKIIDSVCFENKSSELNISLIIFKKS